MIVAKKVVKAGTSYAIILDKVIRETLEIGEGDVVIVEIVKRRIKKKVDGNK